MKRIFSILLCLSLLFTAFCFSAVAVNNNFYNALTLQLDSPIEMTFEGKEYEDYYDYEDYYQESWFIFTPEISAYYEFEISNPFYSSIPYDTSIRIYNSISDIEECYYSFYADMDEDEDEDKNAIKLSAELQQNQKYYICIEVSCLEIESTTTMKFSVSQGEIIPASANYISYGETVDVFLNGNIYAHTIEFAPEKTDVYDFFLETEEIENVKMSIYDSYGNYMASGSYNEYIKECSISHKLKANKTYYLEVYYYGASTNFQNIKIRNDFHKHILSDDDEYIYKATAYYEGCISSYCVKCDEYIEIVIPQVVISISKDEFIYNGKSQIPTVTVTDETGKIFLEGTDYTVTYPKSSINANSYSLTVTMENDYYSIYEYCFYYIEPKSIKNLSAKLSKTNVGYGEIPKIKISGLKEGRDFEVETWYYDLGKQTCYVYGIGNYTDKLEVSFTAVPPSISGLKAAKTSTSYIKLSWNMDNLYATQYYQIYDVKKKKVIATVSSDTTSYTIKNLKAGTSYSYKVRGYTKTNDKKYYGEWKTITVVTKPSATQLTSLKSTKAKSFTAKWNKQPAATGYQIQYSTSSKFTSPKTVKISKNTSTSKTISSLKSGQKYYVRIRTYKTVKVGDKSKTVYSSWSKTISVKAK